ncbi:hypothetical protein [Chryseobacterium candidae]|uniref:Lipoprotein n=1 Tax=Chryseobacterium candidae TaxID=1978493 RepID=A0ABY2R8U5_9FLAO|nr:hypothetical protein [Chryseobacterium candidae]THV61921.1 hypothetical protein EK417_08410 [Chryseobacterium candidae]
MKKLLFIYVLFCLLSCDKIFKKKYYVEIDQNQKNEILGNDFNTKTEEFRAENINEAYKKAYSSFMISKEVAEGTRSSVLDTDVFGFRLLDENKKNITYLIPEKTKDFIHIVINELTAHISKDLKKGMKK